MSDATVLVGDCREVMAAMEPASIDAIVCDPPYGLEFMGNEWDAPWKDSRAKIGQGGKWKGSGWADSPKPQAYVAGAKFQAWSESWAREAFRVLKPGGHLLAFGGTRTFHRMTVAIEDAGFEIRDCISYLYGSGFPKSHNLDRLPGFCRCSALPYNHENGMDDSQLCDLPDGVSEANVLDQAYEGTLLQSPVRGQAARSGMGHARAQGSGSMDRSEPSKLPREDVGIKQSSVEGRGDVLSQERQLQADQVRPMSARSDGDGATGRLRDGTPPADGPHDGLPVDEAGSRTSHRPRPAEQRSGEPRIVADQSGAQTVGVWPTCSRCGLPRIPKGLGTALKPAWEPVIVARKPLIGTVSQNVLQHGTGALNIDGCRIETDGRPYVVGHNGKEVGTLYEGGFGGSHAEGTTTLGRWPANVALGCCGNDPHDPDCAAAMLDAQSGTLGNAHRPNRPNHNGGDTRPSGFAMSKMGTTYDDPPSGASRFFYCAKASRSERNAGLDGMPERMSGSMDGRNDTSRKSTKLAGPIPFAANHHPTVKPVALMQWLVRLVTPPGGVCLDPFTGSGSTGVACVREGVRFIGIEQSAEYAEIAERRIAHAVETLPEPSPQLALDLAAVAD